MKNHIIDFYTINDSHIIMRGKREERLCDNLALRITLSQRTWLEKFGNEKGVSICEGVRLLIDYAMTKGLIEECQ